MKKHIILFSLLLSLMVSFTVNAGPIEVSTTEINFGAVKKGTDKQETFTVSNTGTANVSFTVDASTQFTDCFEVSENLQRFTLKPGGTKAITVTSHGMSAGSEASTEVYILNYKSETVAMVKLKAYGDDDRPLVDRTSLTMNIGEKAAVYLKTSEYMSTVDVEGIVDWIGGGPGTSSGPDDGHNSLYSNRSSGVTFTALKAGVVHVTFKHLYTDETAVLTINVLDPNPPVVNRYAIYNYRNDGDFNAFLNCDVDSITFSNIDFEGRAHPNVVIQEVWTPDSVYRIPLASIDSIAFDAPKTKIKDDVFFITDEHIPYTVSVDTLSMIFSASIPQDLLPSVGNVLVSETFESPFEDGFVGRVNKVRKIGNLVYVVCDDANLFDIYESLVAVGKLVMDSTEAPDGAPRRFPRRILGFDDIDKHGVETFNLGKITLKKAGWKWLSVEYTPEFSIDYVLYIQKDEPVHLKLAISGKHELALVLDYKAYDTNQDPNVEKEIWPCDPPLPSFYGFQPTFKLGLFWDIGGKVDVVGKLPVTITHSLGVEYHGSGNFDINDVNIIKSFDMKFKEPTLDFKIVGYATAGLCADLGVKFLHKKVASIDAILKMGPKISTTFDLSVNDIARDPGVYTVLKNTKVALDFSIGVDAEYRFLKKKAKIKPGLGWPGVQNVNQWADTPYPVSLFQWSWPLFECYLMPEFESHVVNAYDGSNLTFVTSASREVFLPVKLGVRKENSSGQQTTLMNPQTYWISSRDTWAKNYQTTFPTLTGLNYTFKPIVEFLGCQIEATPEVAVNTEEQDVTLEAGQILEVDAKDANGKYTVQSFDPSGVGCTVKGSKITITAYHATTTYILVTNTKNNSNYFIHVTVTGGQGSSVLSITPTTIDFGDVAKGKTETRVLSINNDSSTPQTVTATVDAPFSFTDGMSSMSSTSVVVPGKSCGSLTVAFTSTTLGDYDGNITLTSEALTGGKLIVPVHARSVTNVDPDPNPQTQTITVNGVSFKMVHVDGGTFTMGATAEQGSDAASDERPAHQVTLSSYNIGQTEVTQELWQAVMGSNPSHWTGDQNRPVEEVSWNDCQTFITKLNQMTGKTFRLPTEAEWEFAARGGNKSKGYKYAGSNDINEVAWYDGNADNGSDRGTRPVATKSPNELGLYDMSGNVWEWCQDWYSASYYSSSPSADPTGPESGYNHSFRGGSWGYSAGLCRVSRRGSYEPTYHWRSGGLRLIMNDELEPAPQTETFTVNGVSFKMVAVEGGTFRMGEGASLNDEAYQWDQRPIHDVTVSDFMIGETEVTQKLWKAVMGNNPSYNQNDECPVEKANWNLCQLFIAELNKITGKKFRLPTEAEWEFAARGGNNSHGYRYAGSNNAGEVAWYYYYSGYKTMPVAQKQPNELGLYDMSGNVWEWCYDWYGEYEWGGVTNPCYREEGEDRVIRGGNCTDINEICVFYRSSEHPFSRSNGIGFRLAMGDAILPHLLLSNTSLTLNIGQNYNIDIISGSGNYSIYNSDNSIASGLIENNIIKVSAIGEGVSYISIIDQDTKEKLDIHLTITHETPIHKKTYTVNGVSFNMVYVEGSSFWMGAQEDETDADKDELPCHPVKLDSFYIGQTEVTQGLWEAVMGNNPSHNKDNECPVDYVSWEDCQEFIAKLSDITGCTFRLPTEAEWEYAARGGLNSHGYKFAGSNDLDEVAWHDRSWRDNPVQVAQKKANELGLFDMSGNVAEWCADTYNSEYYASSPIDNPCNDSDDVHVLRGGSQYLFNHGGGRYRVTSRYRHNSGCNDTGLRLVLFDHGGGMKDE